MTNTKANTKAKSDLEKDYQALYSKAIQAKPLLDGKKAESGPDLLPHQIPPDNDTWVIWALLAGRGGGKSFSTMHYLVAQCLENPGLRTRIIAPTSSDAVRSCIEGPNGLLKLAGDQGKWKPNHPGGAAFMFTNGSVVYPLGTFAPRDVEQLRALTNIHLDVFEEAFANRQLADAWNQAMLSRRSTDGYRTRVVVSSTPRPHKLIREWEDTIAKEIANGEPRTIFVSRATTRDNPHLDGAFYAALRHKYEGTRLWKQEVEGLVIDDVEGALWKREDIERSYVAPDDASALRADVERVVVGVDPPSGTGTCGIIAVGVIPGEKDAKKPVKDMYVVLEDASVSDATPETWANAAVRLANKYGGKIVVEVNQGGEMVRTVLQLAIDSMSGIDVKVESVRAMKSKRDRALPISLLWEQNVQQVRIAPPKGDDMHFQNMIGQMLEWVPGESKSPDRVDALVWAVTAARKKVSASLVTRVLSSRKQGSIHADPRMHSPLWRKRQ